MSHAPIPDLSVLGGSKCSLRSTSSWSHPLRLRQGPRLPALRLTRGRGGGKHGLLGVVGWIGVVWAGELRDCGARPPTTPPARASTAQRCLRPTADGGAAPARHCGTTESGGAGALGKGMRAARRVEPTGGRGERGAVTRTTTTSPQHQTLATGLRSLQHISSFPQTPKHNTFVYTTS